jgi:hypothetical protein
MVRTKKLPKQTFRKTVTKFNVEGVKRGKAVSRQELNVKLLQRIKKNVPSVVRASEIELMFNKQAKRIASLKKRGIINSKQYNEAMKYFEQLFETCINGTSSCTGVRAQSYVDLFAFGVKKNPIFKLYYASLKNRGNAFKQPIKKRTRKRKDVILEAEEKGITKKFKRMGEEVEVEMATNITPAHEIISVELERNVTTAVKSLDANAQRIIDLKFGISNGKPVSIDGISRITGIPKQEVKRILKENLAKLSKNAMLQSLV